LEVPAPPIAPQPVAPAPSLERPERPSRRLFKTGT
jgi:hypothetical protein